MPFRALCLLLLLTPALAQRLPTNARPDHYTLHLSPDIAAATFRGSETLDLTLAAPSPTITLNAIELKILSVTAAGRSATISFDPGKEQATFTFPKPLPAGHTALAIEFTGILNDKLRGFYLSKTRKRSYAVSQFESTDARRAFPSFDEPALKATFDVALTVDRGDTAISNTNILSDTPAAGGKHTLTFAPTPRMSTYLVAFLVGDFACSSGAADGVPIRVCSTPDQVKLTSFSLAAAEHFLTYYDRYFGIKYPMPKLDLIAIPDFEAGAMENFGAITYRETELLVDEKEGSVHAKKRVASTVAHEMAHQWFGDMVTMQWWDNLWLNEGFATWMQSKASADWKPEWHFGQDVASELDGTLNYDSERATRTIRATADTPEQIQQMFDGIAYGKAGAVIGMVENYVGPEVFRTGVHNYLAAHLYANASAEDFWNAQTAASKLPVDRIMRSFVDQPGAPLLRFGDPQPKGFPVTQSRFFLSNDAGAATAEPAVAWTIPVCVKGAGCKLLTPADPVLPTTAAAPFFYANANAKGYYRVAYTPAQLRAITAGAETGLTVEERMAFLGERWALTRAAQAPVGDYLDLALALKTDPNADVLDTALESVLSIENRIASDDDRTRLNAVIRKEFGPVWERYSKPGAESDFDRQQIRSELFQVLAAAEDPAIKAKANGIMDALLNHRKVDDLDLIDPAVTIAARAGDEDFYNALQAIVQKTDDPGTQNDLLGTLAMFQKPILVVRTLEYATSGKVRNQDSWVLIAMELSQPRTRDVAWGWVQTHWDKVKGQLTTGSGAQLVSATGSFCTVHQQDEVKTFFAAHPVEASDRSLAKALESIGNCIRLRENQEPNLRRWLLSRAP